MARRAARSDRRSPAAANIQPDRHYGEALEAAKLAALAEFAAGAGHEINNPLAVIAGRAQLLLRGETDPERRRDLAVIISQALRVTEMIADLRFFAACPELECQAMDVTAIVHAAVESFQPAAFEQQTMLICNVPGAQPATMLVNGDPVQIAVAIRALLQNALESVGTGGRVEVAANLADSEVRVSVSDDGPGISPEQRPHIFEPFFSARQAGRGVGMGLSKCWRIVTNHRGRVEVESRPGGAMFTINLPAAK